MMGNIIRVGWNKMPKILIVRNYQDYKYEFVSEPRVRYDKKKNN